MLALLLWAGALHAQIRPAAGLRGTYYAGENFERRVLTRTDPAIDFDWNFDAPGPGLPPESFSVRWTGWLLAPETGTYTFHLTADDGMRVWIGGKLLLNEWRYQSPTSAAATLRLTAGRYYSVRVEYFQGSRISRAYLGWTLPSQPRASPQAIGNQYVVVSLPNTARPIAAAPPAAADSDSDKVARLARQLPNTKITPMKAALVVGYRPKPAPPTPPPARQKRVQPASRPVPAPVSPPDTALPDLSQLRRGAAVTLPNLYFTQSTATLLPASRPVLNALARTLAAQPQLRLEIAGHTDNVGEPRLNLRLSEQRARVVRRYLIGQGIDSVRLAARGYGGTRPVADNGDPQQRPRNRRVEVVVQ